MQLRPTPDELGRFSALQDFSSEILDELSSHLSVENCAAGTLLVARECTDDNALYLLEGRIRMIAADGKIREMDHTNPSAKDPIARLRPSRYEIRAVTGARFLRIDNDLLEEMEKRNVASLEGYEVDEDADLQELPTENRLMIRIYQALAEDTLKLPSLPQVALRIGEAMKDPDIDAPTLSKIIGADPAIAAKLLKVANSPRYSGAVPIQTLHSAIARIGLHTTHQLVISFALRDLFEVGTGILQKSVRELWQHSRRVAAISHVLAGKLKGFDPDEALLAGLLHDIGVIALLGYAQDCPDIDQVELEVQLEETVARLNPQLGCAIIRGWHLPEELAQVAAEAENWHRDPQGKADYCDLVLIAQLHSFVGTDRMTRCPRINEVPAYKKLKLGNLTPDFSLELLGEADDEIREAEELLGS